MPWVLWMLRRLVALALFPFTVTVLIPLWLAGRNRTRLAVGSISVGGLALQAAGLALLAVGLVLFGSSLRRFASEGEGTLAPWDPPRRLVVRGPYRYVRNPMISRGLLVLLGEALVLLSRPHVEWALIFLGINAILHSAAPGAHAGRAVRGQLSGLLPARSSTPAALAAMQGGAERWPLR